MSTVLWPFCKPQWLKMTHSFFVVLEEVRLCFKLLLHVEPIGMIKYTSGQRFYVTDDWNTHISRRIISYIHRASAKHIDTFYFGKWRGSDDLLFIFRFLIGWADRQYNASWALGFMSPSVISFQPLTRPTLSISHAFYAFPSGTYVQNDAFLISQSP